MIYVETPRLMLRDWVDADVIAFREMNADPRVMEFFPAILTAAESESFHGLIQEEFVKRGYGLYAVEEKETSCFIGYIGFHYAEFPAHFTPCVEIGWRLKAEAWGKGYATEGAAACLSYGFKTFSFDRIYSFTAQCNIRSENVMKKLGMEKIAAFDHPKVPEGNPLRPHVLYVCSHVST